MMLVSVSGSAQDVSALLGANSLLEQEATTDADGQWTIVGYADDDMLAALHNINVAVTVIDDQTTVAADFDAALNDIKDSPT